jgi:hypothetical protein
MAVPASGCEEAVMGRTAAVVVVGLGMLALADPASAQDRAARPAPVLRVFVANQAGAPSGVLAAAEKDASSIFAAAGVRLAWVHSAHNGGDFDVVVRIVAGTNLVGLSAEGRGMTLGFALVDEHTTGVRGRIACARFDEITRYAGEHHLRPSRLCGLVIAHEIGHLLLPAGHSRTGLMRARWNLETLLLEHFTQPEVRTIGALLASVQPMTDVRR